MRKYASLRLLNAYLNLACSNVIHEVEKTFRVNVYYNGPTVNTHLGAYTLDSGKCECNQICFRFNKKIFSSTNFKSDLKFIYFGLHRKTGNRKVFKTHKCDYFLSN